jgi:hypothetical protein
VTAPAGNFAEKAEKWGAWPGRPELLDATSHPQVTTLVPVATAALLSRTATIATPAQVTSVAAGGTDCWWRLSVMAGGHRHGVWSVH